MGRILEIKELNAGYKKARDIVRNINIVVEEGEFVGLFGTNGAGKSTILKAITGLLYQQEGRILFYPMNSSEPIGIVGLSTNKRSRMGIKYLTQDAQIFPHFTVKENLLFALNYNKHLFNERVKDILKLFPDMEKNDFLNKKGHELSGGQKEKIAIAMVLITHPRLLLLDEPSTGLSPNLVNTLLKGIREFQENLMGNMGIILIEQQRLLDARKICDSIYLLKNGITIGLNGKPSSEKLNNDMVTDDQLEEFMLVEA